MRSSPSRRGNRPSAPRDHIALLLRSGMTVKDPEAEVLAAARRLERLGLITVEIQPFIRCVDPNDSDYLYSDGRCSGEIEVPENVKELDNDYCCPECDRWVFPASEEKRLHKELRVQTHYAGVMEYLRNILRAAEIEHTAICDGVVRVSIGESIAFLCVGDYCAEERFLTRQWAATQPTCYVLVDAEAAANGFLPEPWLHRVLLVDLVCKKADLCQSLHETARAPLPTILENIAIPVFSHGPPPKPVGPKVAGRAQRRFVVELGSKSVWVEGVQVVAIQAGPRFETFQILWDQFTEDLRAGVKPEDYHPCPLQALAGSLEKRLKTVYSDLTAVRRNVNRLQSDIESTIKRKLGLAINRQDIIETCTWKGQGTDNYGYRLNPAHVAVGPCRSYIVGDSV